MGLKEKTTLKDFANRVDNLQHVWRLPSHKANLNRLKSKLKESTRFRSVVNEKFYRRVLFYHRKSNSELIRSDLAVFDWKGNWFQ